MSEIAKPCYGTLPQASHSLTLPNPLRLAWNLVACWYYRAQERQDLKELEPRLREDVGLSDADIYGEMSKPFWRR